MIPLVDTHCHLLAGLDDGPRTVEEALEMCRLAWADGIRVVAATAHLNEQSPEVTPARIRAAALELTQRAHEAGICLTIYPSAEVMIRPELEKLWVRGDLLGLAGGNRYLLIELPAGPFFELRELVGGLSELGVHPILAHPERHPDLLHEPAQMERLIRLGCLVQVSAGNIAEPLNGSDWRMLRRWVQGGLVHLVGSDAHSPHRRPPRIADAHRQVALWAGNDVADRLCSLNGLMVVEGLPLKVPEPRLPRKRWFLGLRSR
jgi:protein-tyrosine phosphatase